MNTTEEQLRDALAAVGDVVGPADVPELALPSRRGFRVSRRAGLAAAAAASLAAVAAGASLTIGAAGSGDHEPVLAPAVPRDLQMSIFLCAKTSANPACHNRDVTAAQHEAIRTRLTALPEVRSIEFESQEEAFNRFRRLYAGSPEVAHPVQSGEVPAAFRLVLREPGHRHRVTAAVAKMPGVDQVVGDQ